MAHSLNQSVVDLVHQAIGIMDELMREKIDLPIYTRELKALDADSLLDTFQDELRHNPDRVHHLNALMIISSLQHELDFQVAEYGVNVASEDIKMLRELLPRLQDSQANP
jgi:hypothetical protein